jgi:hypothetical protein
MSPQSKNVNDNELYGRQAEDAYWNDRRHYIALATKPGGILCGILSDEELVDFRAHLLLILIRQRQEDCPPHIHALQVELLGGIQHRINMNRNKRAAAQRDR